MILADAGPLVALVDAKDSAHYRCVDALATFPPVPLATTWPCLTEAMHLLRRQTGRPGQQALWWYFDRGLMTIEELSPGSWRRVRELMDQYADIPMDLADASLVATGEALVERTIFTLDSHFYAYRIGGKPFVVIP